MESITKEQADAVGEVANICTGNAATALSIILGQATNITTPQVEILDWQQILSMEDVILVKIPYTRGLDGADLMVLQESDALIIANLMMEKNGMGQSLSAIDEISLSAISEAMNQMCGAIATSLSSILKRPTNIGFPMVNSRYLKTFEIPKELSSGEDIVKVTFRLTVGDLIDSELMQLFPLSIIKQILKQEEI